MDFVADRKLSEQIRRRADGRLIAKRSLQYFFLVLFLLFFLFPFVIMLSRSFMSDREVMLEIPERIFPSQFYYAGYMGLFTAEFFGYFKNTFIIILFNIIGIPLTASMCAFGFSKIRFRGRNTVFGAVLATTMIPSIAMQVPLYIIYNKLGWTSGYLPLIVPNFFGGGALNIFLIMQFMKGIQNDLMDAARIDGASLPLVYARIVLPLCRPVIVLIMVNTFFANWNDYSGPLIYLHNETSYTISLALFYKFQQGIAGGVLANEMMASGVVLMIPCLVLFFIFQRQLIEGVNIGGIKG